MSSHSRGGRFLSVLAVVCAITTAGRLAEAPVKADEAADKKAEVKAKAEEAYKAVSDAYLKADLEGLDAKIIAARRQGPGLTPVQRTNLDFIKADAAKMKPAWWGSTISPSNVSFPAEIWGRRIMANYSPSRALGMQGIRVESQFRETRNGFEQVVTNLIPIVTWKPSLVNNPNPAKGKLAVTQGLRLGDLGEVIVWHELGHNYITTALPMPTLIELFQQHSLLFSHLQEFYADMTALYHTSPPARRVVLMLRLDALDFYDEEEPHTRTGHAIGSLLLAHVLQNPDKWPSIHLPPSVPAAQQELNTIIYLEEHWDPGWSVEESRALREMASDFIQREGDRTLRSKGVMQLPNKTSFSLMAAQDRDFQKQRDAWVKKKLEDLAKSGRTDTLAKGQTYAPPTREKDRRMHGNGTPSGPRIEIPW